MIHIKELTNEKEWTEAFATMKQLRAHLDLDTYLKLIHEAQEKDHYRMFILYDQDEIAAVIGVMPMTTLYYGRFIWVCDLVTDAAKRSQGYGGILLEFVEKWAIEKGYGTIALSSGLQREDAHRFYETRMDYDKVSYVFKKGLS
jgi:GNAT superfamily N-acetyltransferase